MATATKRRKNSVTKFLQDIIDDSKELVDDMIDRAADAEGNVKDAVRDAVDDESETPSGDELAELKAALADLTSKVEKLATVSKK
jgi:polyhydroxyalkanoate synthesis regulator phasin